MNRANLYLLQLAAEHGIAPARCSRCGASGVDTNWSSPGHDDGRDADYLGWQCQRCGKTTGLTRRTIVGRVPAEARPDRRGRPARGRVSATYRLSPRTRDLVKGAASTEGIEQSELVEQILRASRRLR
ncbi:hypothetical protein [Mycobacterium sp.]|uniref:hypothetical protein n=1 Tax=Mycobacterium sp. TaxID=1785 RepID=UPI002C33FEB2|nr:hypothetical protein [Mycobacterium sp.]HTY35410.1 hypothetical protein [Mycobacterium sp.]